jgi:hypothetical protein
MKKYVFIILAIISIFWLRYYSTEQCETQEFRIHLIQTDIDFNSRKISKLRLENQNTNGDIELEIKKLEDEIDKNKENLQDAYNKIHFYRSLKNSIPMELIFLLIGASSLIYWCLHRYDTPTHPKLFWTLIFGWMYILYYVCEKKNL